MNVTVYGLWHLGCVTAACVAAAGNKVVGIDPDEQVVAGLRAGRPPLHEPGLAELVAAESKAGRLSFTADAAEALRGADVLWVAFDTPVNERDEADVEFVRRRLDAVAAEIPRGCVVLISSQVPAGFTRRLAAAWRARGVELRYAYSPENLRLGKAIEVFRDAERVVLGVSDESARPVLAELFAPFTDQVEWMTVESAEMTKHALNAFLATSVTFANELARLCEAVGADAKEVERGLRTEARIGPKAYLSPGAAFQGGTLARDVRFLTGFGRQHHLDTPLFDGVLSSNDAHKDWVRRKVDELLGGRVKGAAVAVLGLTYKPGTDTLRRSLAVELCRWLHERGAAVRAHDPAVRQLPDELKAAVTLCPSPAEALAGADVAVLATEWPDYRRLKADDFARAMRHPRVIDQNWFLAGALGTDPRVTYAATGRGGARPADAPLGDRSAIITGANQGLGKAIAAEFVKAGAGVLLTARNEDLLRQAQAELRPLARDGRPVEVMRADVADAESCRAVVARAAELMPDLAVLVNNAGVYGPKGQLEDVDWDEWVAAVRINLFGTVLMCREIIPHLRRRGYGKIVNLSGGGATAPLPRISAYAASKAAVVRATDTLAEELKDARIDVNAIAPGALNTRLLDEVLEAGPEKVGRQFYERSLKQQKEGGAPPEKAAKLAVFLASAQSDGITGRLISAVWDDWASLPSRRELLTKSDIYTLRRIVPDDRVAKS